MSDINLDNTDTIRHTLEVAADPGPGEPTAGTDKLAHLFGDQEDESGETQEERSGRKKDRATTLHDIVRGHEFAEILIDLEFFVDQYGRPHVRDRQTGRIVPVGPQFYPALRHIWRAARGGVLGKDVLKAVADTLYGETLEPIGGGPPVQRTLYTRAAMDQGTLYYELYAGRVVECDANGWRVIDARECPVLFRSIPNLKPLPEPVPGGDIRDLTKFTNLKTERDARLFVAHIVCAIHPDIQHYILQITGEQGSGKSTASRLEKRLLDPTTPEAVRLDYRDFLQKASHTYMLMLDNLNSVPEWGMDALCRLVTGEGDSKRELYSDDNDIIYELKRGIILNGINTPAERGDVQDRTLPIELERIQHYESEEKLWARFEEAHPELLGAVFDLFSDALAFREHVELSRPPRLADWGEFAAAVCGVLYARQNPETFFDGVKAFEEDWKAVTDAQTEGSVDGSPVAQAIIEMMETHEEIDTTPANLYTLLDEIATKKELDTKDKTWPKGSNQLWRRIKEVKPALTARGINCDTKKVNGARIITIRGVDTAPSQEQL